MYTELQQPALRSVVSIVVIILHHPSLNRSDFSYQDSSDEIGELDQVRTEYVLPYWKTTRVWFD